MDWDFLASLVSTGMISIGLAAALAKILIDHRLAKHRRSYDAQLEARLNSQKSDLELINSKALSAYAALVHQDVENSLRDRSADRDYEADARKRLYAAVGPLRFQLLVAAAEYANRIARIGDGRYDYSMSVEAYFGQSTVYRLLRVLAICELIERQIAIADFAVDPAMRQLLKFKRQAFLCLSSHRVSLGHPLENWKKQEQHIFYDTLAVVASAFIVKEEGGTTYRIKRFDEWLDFLASRAHHTRLDPVLDMLSDFSFEKKPIVWLRMLALAQLCLALVDEHGEQLGLEKDDHNLSEAIMLTQNAHLIENAAEYLHAIEGFRSVLGCEQHST